MAAFMLIVNQKYFTFRSIVETITFIKHLADEGHLMVFYDHISGNNENKKKYRYIFISFCLHHYLSIHFSFTEQQKVPTTISISDVFQYIG